MKHPLEWVCYLLICVIMACFYLLMEQERIIKHLKTQILTESIKK
jgi:hypothetical protein